MSDDLSIVVDRDERELEVIHVRADELVIDTEWNMRSATGSAARARGMPGTHETLTDAQLRADIEARGLLQPIGVRIDDDERVLVRYGFRRAQACLAIDPGYPVACVVLQPSESSFSDAVANIAENIHRRAIEAHELADRLCTIQREHPELTTRELAAAVGISQPYLVQLTTARRNAHPELWERFKAFGLRFGRRLTFREFFVTAKLPQHEQLAAWERLVTEEPKRSPRTVRASVKRRAERLLARVDELEGTDDFRSGARWALRVALGQTPPPPRRDHDRRADRTGTDS